MKNKIIILGVDGLDPFITEELIAQGKLPNFSYLKTIGTYSRLSTTNPAQSPVVWPTIATGKNPGYHGVFDYIKRDPNTYLPELSITLTKTKNFTQNIFLPAYKFRSFWKITSFNKIPTTIIRWPLTFPPEKIFGNMLSGLGIPDLRGTLSRYTFYTTSPIKNIEEKKGDIIFLHKSPLIETVILGPTKISFKIHVENDCLRIIINNKEYLLKEKKWTDWINLQFNIGFLKISGICRFYLSMLKPELKLYLSPLQIDPKNPAFPISYPNKYSIELAKNIDNYHTLGFPEDINAIQDDCFDEEAFIENCNHIMMEREKMFWYEINCFKEGILAFVFDTIDRIQHIFWNTRDKLSPTYDEKKSKKYQDVITNYYQWIDKILGNLYETIDSKTILILLSDHGFTSCHRLLHLNSWLVKNGLMTLKNKDGRSLFRDVDWKKTKAYAVGFSSIYLNLCGREKYGIVKNKDANYLKQSIIESLLKIKDPKNNSFVIKSVCLKENLYEGFFVQDAPDLIIGTYSNYRISSQTAIGEVPPHIFEDNLRKSSGDHLVDPIFVPAVFFINQKIDISKMNVMDIVPLIFRYLDIKIE